MRAASCALAALLALGGALLLFDGDPGVPPAPQPETEPTLTGVAHWLAVVDALISAPEGAALSLDGVDPWIVADLCLSRERPDLARRVAASDTGADADALRRFAASEGRELDAALRYIETVEPFYGADGAAMPTGPVPFERLLSPTCAWAFVAAGDVHAVRRDVSSAHLFYTVALELASELGWLGLEATALDSRIAVHHARFDYRALRADATRLIEFRQRLGDALGAARARNDLAVAEAQLGNRDAAHTAWADARTVFVAHHLPAAAAEVDANLAQLFSASGRYGRAVEYGERARRVADEVGDPGLLDYVLRILGGIYLDIGDPERAVELLGGALASDEEDVTGQGALLLNGSKAFFDSGRPAKADRLRDEAIAWFTSRDDTLGVGNAVFSRALAAESERRLDDALRDYERATELSTDDPNQLGYCQWKTGEVLLRVGRADAGEAALEAALAAANATEDADLEVLVLAALADRRVEQGRFGDALTIVDRGFGALRVVSAELGREPAALARGHDARSRLYYAGVFASAAQGNHTRTFEFLERARAGAARRSLGGADALRGAGLTAAQRREEQLAREELVEAQNGFELARAGGLRSEIQAARQKKQYAERAYQSLLEGFERSGRGLVSPESSRPLALAALQSLLRPSEAHVTYVIGHTVVAALLVTPSTVRWIELGASETLIQACARVEPEGDDFEPVTRELATLLIAPLELPDAVKTLYVSPEGPTSFVPVIDVVGHVRADLSVWFVPSASTLRFLVADRSVSGAHVLALGDPDYGHLQDPDKVRVFARRARLQPLPGSAASVKAIATADDVVLLGPEATETRFRSALATRERWHSIHLACHGLVDVDRPMFSCLAVTPDDQSDGFLSVLEVFQLSFEADLVVLSACNSGRGRTVRGEGMLGLVSAFMSAGSPRVLASLWKVDDDATRAFMTAFYERWRSGHTIQQAVLHARTTVSTTPGWSHPRYWAAWMLWGVAE